MANPGAWLLENCEQLLSCLPQGRGQKDTTGDCREKCLMPLTHEERFPCVTLFSGRAAVCRAVSAALRDGIADSTATFAGSIVPVGHTVVPGVKPIPKEDRRTFED